MSESLKKGSQTDILKKNPKISSPLKNKSQMCFQDPKESRLCTGRPESYSDCSSMSTAGRLLTLLQQSRQETPRATRQCQACKEEEARGHYRLCVCAPFQCLESEAFKFLKKILFICYRYVLITAGWVILLFPAINTQPERFSVILYLPV